MALYSNGWSKASNFLANKSLVYHGFSVTHHFTGKKMEYQHLVRDDHYKEPWILYGENELGRLAQGVGNQIAGTNARFFNRKDQVPIGLFYDDV